MAGRHPNRTLNIALAVASVGLMLAAVEMALRLADRPETVVSGWRATSPNPPIHQLGWRGRPFNRQTGAFMVVLVGAGNVECPLCPPEEPLDLMLERALRTHNPQARVVTLGANFYGQDQQYLAIQQYLKHGRADLIVVWPSLAADVPRNTFRTGTPAPGMTRPKPSFTLRDTNLLGPTEKIGDSLYRSKLSILAHRPFADFDRDWINMIPPADPGAAAAPDGVETKRTVQEALDEQRSPWSIWLTPRPSRVRYGIDLTRALLRRMEQVAGLQGSRFAVLLTADDTAPEPDRVALEHAGHWYLGEKSARDAAVEEIVGGMETIRLAAGALASPLAERLVVTRLAEALAEQEMLTPLAAARVRR